MGDNQVPQTDTGIKIQVFHRQRFLEDIPKGFLGILDKQIRIERQLTFCQPLGDAQLEFHIRIGSSRFVADRRTSDKIVVFEQSEVRHFV